MNLSLLYLKDNTSFSGLAFRTNQTILAAACGATVLIIHTIDLSDI